MRASRQIILLNLKMRKKKENNLLKTQLIRKHQKRKPRTLAVSQPKKYPKNNH